jgi:hypothetical protein
MSQPADYISKLTSQVDQRWLSIYSHVTFYASLRLLENSQIGFELHALMPLRRDHVYQSSGTLRLQCQPKLRGEATRMCSSFQSRPPLACDYFFIARDPLQFSRTRAQLQRRFILASIHCASPRPNAVSCFVEIGAANCSPSLARRRNNMLVALHLPSFELSNNSSTKLLSRISTFHTSTDTQRCLKEDAT